MTPHPTVPAGLYFLAGGRGPPISVAAWKKQRPKCRMGGLLGKLVHGSKAGMAYERVKEGLDEIKEIVEARVSEGAEVPESGNPDETKKTYDLKAEPMTPDDKSGAEEGELDDAMPFGATNPGDSKKTEEPKPEPKPEPQAPCTELDVISKDPGDAAESGDIKAPETKNPKESIKNDGPASEFTASGDKESEKPYCTNAPGTTALIESHKVDEPKPEPEFPGVKPDAAAKGPDDTIKSEDTKTPGTTESGEPTKTDEPKPDPTSTDNNSKAPETEPAKEPQPTGETSHAQNTEEVKILDGEPRIEFSDGPEESTRNEEAAEPTPPSPTTTAAEEKKAPHHATEGHTVVRPTTSEYAGGELCGGKDGDKAKSGDGEEKRGVLLKPAETKPTDAGDTQTSGDKDDHGTGGGKEGLCSNSDERHVDDGGKASDEPNTGGVLDDSNNTSRTEELGPL